MVSLLISVLVLVLILGAICFIIRSAPFIDEPFKSWGIWAVMVIGLIVFIMMLLPLANVQLP